MEEVVNFGEIVNVIKKRSLGIVSTALLGLGASAVVSYFVMDKQYSSEVQMIAVLPTADKGQTNNNLNDVNFNLQMINTYKDMMNSDIIIEQVQTELEESHQMLVEKAEIRGMSQVVQNTNSQMFSLKVTTNDPLKSQTIANVQADVFKQTATDVLAVDKVNILSEARANLNPVSPNTKLILLIGTVLGLAAGLAISLLLELMDKTVKKESFIEETLDIPNLGSIYTFPNMYITELKTTQDEKVAINSNNKEKIQTEPLRRTRRRHK
ncbi:YveK family protein [Vagococcus zengguangii]|uniref:YveK family protein n=1 Tax=Vagococcus zengguangii TaxID=2571750 RepID=UPI001109F911|nr:Wzz/FepE/Etk N-terminal domain-containing protein [Vagococcus zengguangii]TLG80935.1 tyrosine protein kinase [Vagococcus zengguangii]